MIAFRATLRRNQSGLSLAEVIVVMGVMSLVVAGATSMLTNCSRTSTKTQTQNQLDSSVAVATEEVIQHLMEARTFVIDNDSMGITYCYPTQNTDGTYTSSAKATDPASHRLYVSSGKLYCSDSPSKPILTDVPTNDPDTGAPMQIFSNGAIGKSIVVRLAASRITANNVAVYSAITVRVRPRNGR